MIKCLALAHEFCRVKFKFCRKFCQICLKSVSNKSSRLTTHHDNSSQLRHLLMSRNKEKSQSLLNRFYNLKNKEAGVLESNPNLRPKYVQSVESLPQAEKWRSTIISEISVNLTRIQDSTINDYQIRELNDKLNKLFREKRSWEYHIKLLGGNDYINFGKDFSGSLVHDEINLKGYRYFGRAKELPDVKKMLDLKKKKNVKSEVKPQERHLDQSYYGFYDEIRDGNENVLAQDEEDLVLDIQTSLGEENYEDGELRSDFLEQPDPLLEYEKARGINLLREMKETSQKIESSVPILDFPKVVPSMGEVEKWLVERKKKALLERLGMKGE